MNKKFQHKDAHKFNWSSKGQKYIIDYITRNGQFSEMTLDIRGFRGYEIESVNYLVISKARIPSCWL